MESNAKILQLRQLLAERFPQPSVKAGARCMTGIPALDEPLEGGISRGAITELIAPNCTGSGFVINAILHGSARTHRWLVLIDGSDCFDPQPLEQAVLDHLLWVRCTKAATALQCADLLLRDGNLPLVILDLQQNKAAELRKIPNTAWYRLQRIVEQSAVAALVVTPRSLVSSAHVKLALNNRLSLASLLETQEALLSQLEVEIVRQQNASQRMIS